MQERGENLFRFAYLTIDGDNEGLRIAVLAALRQDRAALRLNSALEQSGLQL
jgi:hypothetical protein